MYASPDPTVGCYVALGTKRNQRYAVISCVVLWLISNLACIRPMLLHGTFKQFGTEHCEEFAHIQDINVKTLKKSGFYIQLFVSLILPLAVIIFCFAIIVITVKLSKVSSKSKVVRLVFVIVLLFFSCYIPLNIVDLLQYEFTSCEAPQKLCDSLQITRSMAYFYINPVFYTLVGRKLQEYLRQLLVKHFSGC
ncbi:C-C chemokine receptor type 1-like [Xiphophorus maculatus]|uniref:C-C chemokine receptor type 1-like n=1 Tax=Xiphophorus maculatus TaxID=8083 RepID=UPI000C6E25AB|nr:C-C chemokine receptor type 1-like [Xiphophorus maculatus]